MRKVFSSPRIENVEAVAGMLEEAGIEVRISDGRSYRGAIRGNFSYREHSASAPRPAVWVIRSDQQPEARRLLREAGLLQELPVRGESYLPSPAALAGGDRSPLSARGGGRFRYGMLLAVAVMVALVMVAYRAGQGDGTEGEEAGAGAGMGEPAAAARLDGPPRRDGTLPEAPVAPAMPEVATLPDAAFVLATPPALAATLLRAELAAAGTVRACLAIDGADPERALLQQMSAEGFDVAAASACGDDRLGVDVGGYTTDGSGSGTVRITVGGGEPREVAVRREGRDWFTDGAR